MYRNSYQRGLLTIFSSAGSQPLLTWAIHVQNGHIRTNTDAEIKTQVLDIIGANVSTTYITCPKIPKQSLGIHLPYLVMVLKNLHKYFTFEVTILDDTNCRRRFRVSNFQAATAIHPFCTAMPIGLSGGWNQVQFNLADFTRRAYNRQFAEVIRVQINANVRLKRVYFSQRLYTEEELPKEYKIFVPIRAVVRRPLRPSPAEAPIEQEMNVPSRIERSPNASKKSSESKLVDVTTESATLRDKSASTSTHFKSGSQSKVASRTTSQDTTDEIKKPETVDDEVINIVLSTVSLDDVTQDPAGSNKSIEQKENSYSDKKMIAKSSATEDYLQAEDEIGNEPDYDSDARTSGEDAINALNGLEAIKEETDSLN